MPSNRTTCKICDQPLDDYDVQVGGSDQCFQCRLKRFAQRVWNIAGNEFGDDIGDYIHEKMQPFVDGISAAAFDSDGVPITKNHQPPKPKKADPDEIPEQVLGEIVNERGRQDEEWGESNHHDLVWLPILMEEVGEVAKKALKAYDKKTVGFDRELIQVAAVAAAWRECRLRNENSLPKDMGQDWSR